MFSTCSFTLITLSAMLCMFSFTPIPYSKELVVILNLEYVNVRYCYGICKWHVNHCMFSLRSPGLLCLLYCACSPPFSCTTWCLVNLHFSPGCLRMSRHWLKVPHQHNLQCNATIIFVNSKVTHVRFVPFNMLPYCTV